MKIKKRSFWLRYNKKRKSETHRKNWLLPAFASFDVVTNGSWNIFIRSGSVVANRENNSNFKKRFFTHPWILCHFIIRINLFVFPTKLDRLVLANPSYWAEVLKISQMKNAIWHFESDDKPKNVIYWMCNYNGSKVNAAPFECLLFPFGVRKIKWWEKR